MVFCRIASWIIGRRLVSLPFSDHREPLVKEPGQEHVFLARLEETVQREHLRYIEIRTTQPFDALATLFHRLHRSRHNERFSGR